MRQSFLSPYNDLSQIFILMSLRTSLMSTFERSSIGLSYDASGEHYKKKTLFTCWNFVGTSTVTLPSFSSHKFCDLFRVLCYHSELHSQLRNRSWPCSWSLNRGTHWFEYVGWEQDHQLWRSNLASQTYSMARRGQRPSDHLHQQIEQTWTQPACQRLEHTQLVSA